MRTLAGIRAVEGHQVIELQYELVKYIWAAQNESQEIELLEQAT